MQTQSSKSKTAWLWVLASTSAASIALLSFVGMYMISPSLALAGSCFLMTFIIETEVNRQSLKGTFSKGFKNDFIYRYLAQRELQRLADMAEKGEIQNCYFLDEYLKAVKHLHALKKRYRKDKAYRDELKRATTIVADMQRRFQQWMLSGIDAPTDITGYEGKKDRDDKLSLADAIEELTGKKAQHWRANLAKEIKHRKLLTNCARIATISSVALIAMVTITSLKDVLAIFALSSGGAAVAATGVGLAVIGAVGYGAVLYHSMTEIALKFDASLIKSKLKSLYLVNRKPGEPWRRSLLRWSLSYTLLLLVLSSTVIATIATAGTWMTYLDKRMGFVNWILIMLNSIGEFSFSITNSVQATLSLSNIFINYIKETFVAPIQNRFRAISKMLGQESWLARINPFRFMSNVIAVPFRAMILVGYLFSEGLSGDRLGRLNPLLVILFGSISVSLTNSHFLFGSGEHEMDHNTGEQEVDTDMPSIALRVLLAPVLALSVIWNWLSSKKQFPIINHQNTIAKHDNSLKKQFQHTFGVNGYDKSDLPVTEVDDATIKITVLGMLEQWQQRYSPNNSKHAAIQGLIESVSNKKVTDKDSIQLAVQNKLRETDSVTEKPWREILTSHHSILFRGKKPHSTIQLKQLEQFLESPATATAA